MSEYYEYYDIPNDVKLEKLFKNLTINEILNLCSTSKDFSKICEEEETWVYLLWRDFRILYDSDNEDLAPKDYYIYYYNTDKGKLIRYIKNINEKNFFNILKLLDRMYAENELDTRISLSDITDKLLEDSKINNNDLNNLYKIHQNLVYKLSQVLPNEEDLKQLAQTYFYKINPVYNHNNFANYIITLGSQHYYDFLSNPLQEIVNNFNLYTRLERVTSSKKVVPWYYIRSTLQRPNNQLPLYEVHSFR